MQSANDEILKEIGRIHNYADFTKIVEEARNVGFENISVDVMMGLPNQSINDIDDTLNKMINLKIQHISVYSLMLEEGTKLEKLIQTNKLQMIDEELERDMYWFAKRKLEENGYTHYEISNYAKDEKYSRHNTDCWSQKEYLGFGVNASSFEDNIRYTNTSNINQYMENIEQGNFKENQIVEEKMTKEQMMKEFIAIGLRKLKGINVDEFNKKFQENLLSKYRKEIDELKAQELIIVDENIIKLSNKGIDFADEIWRRFL